MTNIFSVTILIFSSVLSSGHVRDQGQTKKNEISAEGAIVAFQKTSRHSITPAIIGIATPVESWIVRIDKWAGQARKDQKYILVLFNLSERAVSDSEINSDKLSFSLRQRQAGEHIDCLGSISVGDRRSSKFRPARLSDYQRTKAGSADRIPSLESLPCFIADAPPVVVD